MQSQANRSHGKPDEVSARLKFVCETYQASSKSKPMRNTIHRFSNAANFLMISMKESIIQLPPTTVIINCVEPLGTVIDKSFPKVAIDECMVWCGSTPDRHSLSGFTPNLRKFLPFRLSKHQSMSSQTVLLRTTLTRPIVLNLLMTCLLSSNQLP